MSALSLFSMSKENVVGKNKKKAVSYHALAEGIFGTMSLFFLFGEIDFESFADYIIERH